MLGNLALPLGFAGWGDSRLQRIKCHLHGEHEATKWIPNPGVRGCGSPLEALVCVYGRVVDK